MSRRVERAEKELQQIIASYMITGFKYPLKGLVSVSRVQASPDLRHAKVFVSVMGSEDDADESIETLTDNAQIFQKEVGKKLPMKFCPKLKFFLDEGLKNSIKVQGILSQLPETENSDERTDHVEQTN